MFEPHKIVAILTAYKRDYFSQQINSLLNQTQKIDKIVIFNNGSLDLSHLKNTFKDKISLINSELNTKFWGRFAIASLFNTEYVLMLDDDTIPGLRWVETCYNMCLEKNCIVTGNGRSIDNKVSMGDGGYTEQDTKIAFGGHSWFYRKEWLKYFLMQPVVSYDTGEDISFSAYCKINGDIDTWLPKQSGESSAHSQSYCDDQHASFRLNSWDLKREAICQHFVNLGWTI